MEGSFPGLGMAAAEGPWRLSASLFGKSLPGHYHPFPCLPVALGVVGSGRYQEGVPPPPLAVATITLPALPLLADHRSEITS